MIEELDVVALRADLPDLGLKKGERGTVVMMFGPTRFLAEFADDRGVERATLTLSAEDVEVVWRAADHRAPDRRAAG